MSEYPAAAQPLLAFTPKKDFFIGIDSDGCAMDVMTIKHEECFAPAAIKQFGLQPISHIARETWMFVNLYSATRGCNRWVALDLFFDHLRNRADVAARGIDIPPMSELKAFLSSDHPNSDDGIAAYAREHPSQEIDTCREWSRLVGDLTTWMVHGCAPFPGVKEAFEAMSDKADCMTVSAANLAALTREWGEHGLTPYMEIVAGQEMGTKAQHLAAAAVGKYPSKRILLLGDAPGDLDAARSQGVCFYPITPGAEAESWRRLREEALPRFFAETYRGDYENTLVEEFRQLLPSRAPWESTGDNVTTR
ncbi:MAG: hypothetical protein Q4B10_06690 [Actinomycetaceae bacterium]|nr:hypothetical protein [Actinomycetaceae bacterium]